MIFLTVVVPREDGDVEAVAAFNADFLKTVGEKNAIQFANEFKIFLNGVDWLKDAQVMEFENVTDVIEHEYTIEQTKSTKALWQYQLECTCPFCNENIDVANCESVQEFIFQEKQDLLVECPRCLRDFKIDMVM